MKLLVICLFGLCTLAAGLTTFQASTKYHKEVPTDGEWSRKQLEILRFFRYVHQQTYYKDHYDTAKAYNMMSNLAGYSREEPVKELMYYYQRGMLRRGEIFSIYYPDQLREAVAYFRTLYYAKTWDTFWKTACWGRTYLNEYQFVYAISLAVVHRPELKSIILPPIYEIFPNYFFPTEVMYEAQRLKQMWNGKFGDDQKSGFQGYTVRSNYSGWYMNLHPEQSLSYYTEDVGLNAFYYYYNLYYPFWMDSQEFQIRNPRRGEQFYYLHQQLLARYYLERLSEGFGEIWDFDWEAPFKTGYYPSLRYANGMEFPARPSNADLYRRFFDGAQTSQFYYKNYTYTRTYIRDYERRIRDAIDRGFIYNREGQMVDLYQKGGMEILGNLIESNPDSPNSRYYGDIQTFARFLMGYSYYPMGRYQIAPSAMEHYETCMRDPAFYQLYKKIVNYFLRYKNQLRPYTREQLLFQGVEIIEAQFEPLITYFEKFYADITNGIYVNREEFLTETFQVRAQQERLTYKPFAYMLKVQSEKPTRSMVRVFIGPKYDEYGRRMNMTYNNRNFVEFDRFIWDLKAGENTMKRPYNHNNRYSSQVSYRDLMRGVGGKTEMPIYKPDYYYNPNTFMLPKGSRQGTTYQFYFIVTPYVPEKVEGQNEWYWPSGFDYKYADQYALGYPFDRPIYDERSFRVPNSYVEEVKIYNKDYRSINSPHY